MLAGCETKVSTVPNETARTQTSSASKNFLPASRPPLISKLIKPKIFQEINYKLLSIPKLTKSLYFVGFLILNSKVAAVFGENLV